MKLRRSLALAAATAAVTPAVLLAAPVAYATDDVTPTPAVSESTPDEGGPAPAAGESSPGAEDSTPAGEESTPAGGESSSASSAPSASSSPSAAASASASATASASPSVSASASEGPVECGGDEFKTDKNLRTSLSGLPSKIVAGSGFHGFKLNVKNTGDRAYQRVDFGVFAAQVDEEDYFIDTSHLTLQYKDPASGTWKAISLDETDEGAGYLGYTDVKAHESFSIDLRLAVDKSAPAGLGYAISIGMYADDEGNCVFSGDGSYYEFDILKAGTAPGDPGNAKPQGGKKPLPQHQPAGNTKIEPQGHLAQTGSSSALPAIALAGGAAVALGAGAVFVVRRRRNADSGTAA